MAALQELRSQKRRSISSLPEDAPEKPLLPLRAKNQTRWRFSQASSREKQQEPQSPFSSTIKMQIPRSIAPLKTPIARAMPTSPISPSMASLITEAAADPLPAKQ